MKRLFLLTLATASLMTAPAFANHDGEHAALHNIVVEVNGLVCDFCARAVEKVFHKQDGVQSVDVDLDTHTVTIGITEEAQLSDEQIEGFITDAGYNMVEIRRGDESDTVESDAAE